MPPKDRKLEQLVRISEDSDNLIVYAANLVSWSKGEIEDFEKRKILLSIGYSDEVTCNKCHKQPCTVNPKIVECPDGQKKGVCYCSDPEQGGPLEFELDELKYWEINKDKLIELGYWLEKPEDSYITFQEAADILGIEKGTVSKWSGKGKFKDNGCIGQSRKLLLSSVLLAKHEGEEKDLKKDVGDLRRDAKRIRD